MTGVREEYRVGQRTLLDVLNAEQELLNSRTSLVQALANAVAASYSVVSAVGRLTAEDLREAITRLATFLETYKQ